MKKRIVVAALAMFAAIGTPSQAGPLDPAATLLSGEARIRRVTRGWTIDVSTHLQRSVLGGEEGYCVIARFVTYTQKPPYLRTEIDEIACATRELSAFQDDARWFRADPNDGSVRVNLPVKVLRRESVEKWTGPSQEEWDYHSESVRTERGRIDLRWGGYEEAGLLETEPYARVPVCITFLLTPCISGTHFAAGAWRGAPVSGSITLGSAGTFRFPVDTFEGQVATVLTGTG